MPTIANAANAANVATEMMMMREKMSIDVKQKEEDGIECSDVTSEVITCSWQQRMRAQLGIDKTKSWADWMGPCPHPTTRTISSTTRR